MCIDFLFVNCNVLIAFLGGLMPIVFYGRKVSGLISIVLKTQSIEPTAKQRLLCFWQIKNDTLAGFFCFCGCQKKCVQCSVCSVQWKHLLKTGCTYKNKMQVLPMLAFFVFINALFSICGLVLFLIFCRKNRRYLRQNYCSKL